MTHHTNISILTSCVAASLLTACVSDSKNNDTSNSSSSTPTSFTQSTIAAYTGSRDPAYLTTANAAAFTMSLFDNDDFSDALNNDPNQKARPNAGYQQRLVSTENCQFGGTFSTDETVHTETTVTKISFSACQRTYASPFDGDLTLTFSNYDNQNNPTIYSLGTNNLIRTLGTTSKTLKGSFHFVESANTITSTANLYRSDSRTNIQYLLQDFKLVDGQVDAVSGRVYRSLDGYIVLSSSADLVTNTHGAPSQGHIYINGAEGSTIRLSSPSDSTLRNDYTLMELDAEGDDIYEQQELVSIVVGSFESIK